MTMRRESRTTMNRALDEELDQRERAAFHAQLDTTPEDVDLWSRMRRVDRTLNAAATVNAPERFAERVLAAITKRLPSGFDYVRGTGLALGLYTAVAISVALLVGGLIGLVALWNSGAVANAIVGLRTAITNGWNTAETALSHLPNASILALIAATGTAGAVGLAKLVALPSPIETHRIPVQFYS